MSYKLKINQAKNKGVVLPRRLWRDDDGNIVENGDPKARYLVGAKGYAVSPKDVERLGLDAYLKKTGKGAKPKSNKRKTTPKDKAAD